MGNEIFNKEELLEKVEINEKTLSEWEGHNLLKPVGFTDENQPYYSYVNIEKAIKIKKLIELGYQPDEIKRIIKKVGLPKEFKTKSKEDSVAYLTVGNLAEQVNVSPRTIKHWEDKGIIDPDMRSQGGFRLYSRYYVYLCKLIKDLQLFGYSLEEIKTISDYFRDFLAAQSNINSFSPKILEKKLNEMISEIDRLYEKMNQFKEGMQRWDELLKKKKKEVVSLINQNQKNNEKKEISNE
jgi:DNA-binding transcriptional MerR regulator